MKRVIHINNEIAFRSSIHNLLLRSGFEVNSVSNLDLVDNNSNADIVLSYINNQNTINFDYLRILENLKKKFPTTPILFITEGIRICKAMQLARLGLYSCLNKPIYPEELIKTLHQALKDTHSHKSTFIKKEIENYVYGESLHAKRMHQHISIVKNTPFSVIIYGETGTGKEAVARMLNPNPDQAFVAIDCGCLTKDLARSELFGHIKGAFTGALTDKVGAFEQANGGTLFLDEIGNLSLNVQMYLLRAIQERKISRIGCQKQIDLKVRIIVASNENLKDLVLQGKFREDLYHRLNEFQIKIPPLRKRQPDIPLFTQYFIQQVNKELNKKVLGVTTAVDKILKKYSWPGNIRELRNVIRRGVLVTPHNNYIDKQHLPREFLIEQVKSSTEKFSNSTLSEASGKAEIEKIKDALILAKNNKTKAAKILNINRKTLYNKIKKLKVKV